jgi:hypothetical protein
VLISLVLDAYQLRQECGKHRSVSSDDTMKQTMAVAQDA